MGKIIMLASGSDAIYLTVNTSSSIFWTVFSGVSIFVIGQLIIEFFLKPYMRFVQLKARISYCIVYYARLYCNPVTYKEYFSSNTSNRIKDEYDQAGKELRCLASELAGFMHEKWRFNLYIPNNQNIAKAVSALIGLSNNLVVSENHNDIGIAHNEERVEEIKNTLGILKNVNL